MLVFFRKENGREGMDQPEGGRSDQGEATKREGETSVGWSCRQVVVSGRWARARGGAGTFGANAAQQHARGHTQHPKRPVGLGGMAAGQLVVVHLDHS